MTKACPLCPANNLRSTLAVKWRLNATKANSSRPALAISLWKKWRQTHEHIGQHIRKLVRGEPHLRYITVEREPLETLIAEWTHRGDQLTLLSVLLARARNQLAETPEYYPGERRCSPLSEGPQASSTRELDAAIRESATAIARHRHWVRSAFASQFKQILRSAIRDVGVRTTDAVLAGKIELANRIESDRQTVRAIIGVIDASLNRMLKDDLTAAVKSETQK